MTNEGLSKLVAYLKEMAAKNQGKSVAPVSSGGGNDLSSALLKYGPKAAKWGYNAYTQPAAAYAAGSGSGAIAPGVTSATEGAAGSATATMAGETAGEGLGLSGLGGASIGQYVPLIGPFIAAYLNYQKGSGRNDPEIRRAETSEAGRQLMDLSQGKDIDQGTYSLPSKYLPGKSLVSWNNFDQVQPELDPAGYSPFELYDIMHKGGAGYKKMLSTDSSGQTDQEIDDMLYKSGMDRATLSKLTGLDIPDWSQGGNYADWLQVNNERNNPYGNSMDSGPQKPQDDWRKLSKLLEEPRMITNY